MVKIDLTKEDIILIGNALIGYAKACKFYHELGNDKAQGIMEDILTLARKIDKATDHLPAEKSEEKTADNVINFKPKK